MPPAPERLSTTTCCPSPSPSFGATERAITSVPPPGGNGTMKRIGFDGHVCDCAGAAAKTAQSVRLDDTTIFLSICNCPRGRLLDSVHRNNHATTNEKYRVSSRKAQRLPRSDDWITL